MREAAFAVACIVLAGAAPSPAPVVTPLPVTSASPAPTPSAVPTVLMLAPDAPPQILWIGLSSTTPRAGDTLAVTVVTSSNVASVELRVGGYGTSMTKTDVGLFESASQVPSVPFFMSHSFTLQIIVRNTGGVAVEQDVPLQVH